MMNDAETVDFVQKFLKKQGAKSLDNYSGMCRLRHGKLRCALGCLIPDELYSERLEGWDLPLGGDGPKQLVDALEQAGYRNINLLAKLQWVHDQISVSQWTSAFKLLKRDLDESYGDFQRKVHNEIDSMEDCNELS